MSEKILSIEELAKMQDSFIEATQTDTPVAVQTPTSSVVNGEPTKIGSTEPKDYTLVFYLPVPKEGAPAGTEIVMDGKAYKQVVHAEEKFVSPRIARKVRHYASTLALAFTDLKEDGSSEIYTVEDLIKVYEVFDDNVIDACEKLLGSVLGVSDSLIQYITDQSLIDNCSKILENNPSFFQAD